MRIIAGEFRSRKLISPPEDAQTRPLPDRVKESIFSILRGNIDGAVVYDGFAGTGAFGFEALSRGAARCVFVEKDKRMAGVIERNIEMLGVGDRCELVVGDVLGPGALARCPRPADLIFLDPPYPLMCDRLGSKRIKGQLGMLGDCLGEAGFALLRTPWPLHYAIDEAAEAVIEEPEARKARRGKRGRRDDVGDDRGRATDRRGTRPERRNEDREDGGWQEVWSINKGGPLKLGTDGGVIDDESAEGLAEDGFEEPGVDGAGPAEASAPAHPKPKPQEIDLHIEALRGPETHEYSGMAVHFYMRRAAVTP